ncbi:MAG: hypothetical protein ACYTJ0_09780 [Planctomycetota bacterium]|jgi:hypothetical protein
MTLARLLAAVVVTAALGPWASVSAQEMVDRVIAELNRHPTVDASSEAVSYRILFDAYLEAGPPPFEVGPDFNMATIHPGMSAWGTVSDWAESNPGLAAAVMEVRDRPIVGLPYGRDNVPQAYQDGGVYVDIGIDGNLRNNDFAYLQALRTIEAYVTAEVYRRMEAGDADDGLHLAVAQCFLLRQFCDREFLEEKKPAIQMLSMALSNMRDVFHLYLDKISSERFSDIAWFELPFIRPDRNRLFIPEADRVVSETMIKSVFDENTGEPMPEAFARAFAGIQAREEPLTRFGAARRWKMIADVHGSLDASLERLELVYDDWWRRWRVQEYDPILALDDQFNRTNPVRYAAVIYSVQDIKTLFPLRNQLVAEVNGTAMAAGLCAYRSAFGSYPSNAVNIYSQFIRKRTDTDPFDREFGRFKYRQLDERHAIDTPVGRVWVEEDGALLWSLGQDNEDGRAREHTPDGASGDLVVWPPIRALAREQGLID